MGGPCLAPIQIASTVPTTGVRRPARPRPPKRLWAKILEISPAPAWTDPPPRTLPFRGIWPNRAPFWQGGNPRRGVNRNRRPASLTGYGGVRHRRLTSRGPPLEWVFDR